MLAHETSSKSRTKDVVVTAGLPFASFGLRKEIEYGLQNAGYVNPSPIQLKAIPVGLTGRDVIAQAKSGTGKTCVFTTLLLNALQTENLETQALVLAPTREIAIQIHNVVCTLGVGIQQLSCHTFIGGTLIEQDKVNLVGCQICIGTPGRIKALIDNGSLRGDSIQMVVLDEADKLLEEGSFRSQINAIMKSLPKEKQTIATSATYPSSLSDVLMKYMVDPIHVKMDDTEAALLGVAQYFWKVDYHDIAHKMFENKTQKLIEVLSGLRFNQCLIFSNYQIRAEMLSTNLNKLGWPATYIAGSQSQMIRNSAIRKLKDYSCRILVTTDLTARGIDCDGVNFVVNLDIPWDVETYLHRVGRCGRYGSRGVALTLIASDKEESDVKGIGESIGYRIDCLPDDIVLLNKYLDGAGDLKKNLIKEEKNEDINESVEYISEIEVGGQSLENAALIEQCQIKDSLHHQSEVTDKSKPCKASVGDTSAINKTLRSNRVFFKSTEKEDVPSGIQDNVFQGGRDGDGFSQTKFQSAWFNAYQTQKNIIASAYPSWSS